MKKLIFSVLLFFCLTIRAHADAVIFYPINAAVDEETSFYEYFPIGLGGSTFKNSEGQTTYIGDGGGVAYEFNLTKSMDVNSILVPVAVNSSLPNPGTAPATLSLFSGSSNHFEDFTFPNGEVVPNIDNVLLREDFTAVGTNLTKIFGNQAQIDNPANYTFEGITGADLTLAPGDYWVGVEGGDSFTYYEPQIELAGNAASSNTAAAPEPPSAWLMFLGLAAGFLYRNRKIFGHCLI